MSYNYTPVLPVNERTGVLFFVLYFQLNTVT